MNLTLAYWKRSRIEIAPQSLAVALAPNLRRDKVSFEGRLLQPLRFREAMAALHDVVISDLRYQPKDRTADRARAAERQRQENLLRKQAVTEAQQELLLREPEPLPEGLEARFRDLRKQYWDARQEYSNYLMRHDPEMWRKLRRAIRSLRSPPTCFLLRVFQRDESSYGCLTVDRALCNGTRHCPWHHQR